MLCHPYLEGQPQQWRLSCAVIYRHVRTTGWRDANLEYLHFQVSIAHQLSYLWSMSKDRGALTVAAPLH